MSNVKFNSSPLIKLQDYGWYILLFYFLIAFCTYIFGISFPIESGFVGVLIALLLTLMKLLLMAELFRRIKMNRMTYIAFLLLLILAITIVVRTYL